MVRTQNAQRLEEERFVDIPEGAGASDADGAQRIAVICVLHRDDAPTLWASHVRPELDGHLQRDLNRAGAVFAEEDVVQAGREERGETIGEVDHRLMRDPEQRTVLQPRGLTPDRLDDVRMAVPVHDGPHRGHAVDVLTSVLCDQEVSLGAVDHELRLAFEAAHLRKGMPHMGARGPAVDRWCHEQPVENFPARTIAASRPSPPSWRSLRSVRSRPAIPSVIRYVGHTGSGGTARGHITPEPGTISMSGCRGLRSRGPRCAAFSVDMRGGGDVDPPLPG